MNRTVRVSIFEFRGRILPLFIVLLAAVVADGSVTVRVAESTESAAEVEPVESEAVVSDQTRRRRRIPANGTGEKAAAWYPHATPAALRCSEEHRVDRRSDDGLYPLRH